MLKVDESKLFKDFAEKTRKYTVDRSVDKDYHNFICLLLRKDV